jgi:hypothetical protein
MGDPAILRSLLTRLCHAIVMDDGCNPKAVIPEDAAAARRLRRAVTFMAAPRGDRRFVAPE